MCAKMGTLSSELLNSSAAYSGIFLKIVFSQFRQNLANIN